MLDSIHYQGILKTYEGWRERERERKKERKKEI